MDHFADLEPRPLWRAFLELCSIPRPSHGEQAATAWALERARGLGLAVKADAAGNVAISKPASPGFDGAPGLVLQAHLDMVPQKTETSNHDFSRDPIVPRLDPEDAAWLRATETTLGADDGIGVAAAFALLEDEHLAHGPLEVLLTVNEEDGMTGARSVQPGFVSGEILLNLDGESEEELCYASAGGSRLLLRFDEEARTPEPAHAFLEISVRGLKGGHSGADIQLGRASAIRVLVSALAACSGSGLRLARLEGGSLPNAIAREARAAVALPRAGLSAFRSRIEASLGGIRASYAAAEPDFRFDVVEVAVPDEAPGGAPAASSEASERVLAALAAAPDGLVSMLEGEVARLSSNLGALSTSLSSAGRLLIEGRILVRGAFDGEKDALSGRITQAIDAGGGSVEFLSGTPAWAPNPDSPLLAKAVAAWQAAYGREPTIRATHGGLECGLFRSAFPVWDMLSVGPTIRNPHSPDEALKIASVAGFYAAISRLVGAIARVAS